MNLYKKTYLFAVIFGSMVIGSCSSYIVPLKGNYSDIPAKITSIETVDSIWLHINQLFSEKGLVIKKSDREKGIIVSAKSRFSSAYTFEDNKGQLIEPEAWIVLKEVFVNKKKWNPKKISCRWEIQIAQTEKMLSTITVSPIVVCTYYPNMFTTMETHVHSTGKLEELLRRSAGNK